MSRNYPNVPGAGSARVAELMRVEKILKRRVRLAQEAVRLSNEKATQEEEEKQMTQEKTTNYQFVLTAEEKQYLGSKVQWIRDNIHDVSVFLVSHGCVECDRGGSTTDPVERAHGRIIATIRQIQEDKPFGLRKNNGKATRALIEFMKTGEPFPKTTPPVSNAMRAALVVSSIQPSVALLQKEVAKLRVELNEVKASRGAPSESNGNEPTDEEKGTMVCNLVRRFVKDQAKSRGEELSHEDFGRAFGRRMSSFYLLLGDELGVTLPSSDSLRTGDGDSEKTVIRWVVNHGYINQAISLARKLYETTESSK